MKFGIRTPSLTKRFAARTSWKRFVRHNLGVKAPRGWGWLMDPKRAAYNRVYNRTTVSVDRLFRGGSRRRGGSGGDVAALLAILALVALAAFGVYLLVAGLVGFVVWLVRIVARNWSAHGIEDVIPPAPPTAEYEPLVPVDPAVFTDDQRVDSAARDVFAAWLRHIPRAPRNGGYLVQNVVVRRRLIGRLVTLLQGRRFVWRQRPVDGGQAPSPRPVDPAALDPWNPPADLGAMSRHTIVCDSCDGSGRVACGSCGGSGRLACPACSGSGKYFGTSANGARRWLNCKDCRGKGSLKCDVCKRGVVVCGSCHDARRLERWLEVDGSVREDVQMEADGEVIKAFAWGREGSPASSNEMGRDAIIMPAIERPRALVASDLPASVPEHWRQEHWPRLKAALEPGERVAAQALTLLEVPSTDVTYSVLGHREVVALEGLRMLAPPPWSAFLFTRRATLLGRLRPLLAILPLAALATYLARGSYFVSGRAVPLLWGITGAVVTVAACTYGAFWYATLGRRSVAIKWVIATIAPLASFMVLAFVIEPASTRARRYMDRGQLDAARRELETLGAPTRHDVGMIWADLHLRYALAAGSCVDARRYAERISKDRPQAAVALTHTDALALRDATDALADGDLVRASAAIECAGEVARQSAEGLRLRGTIAIRQARRCIERKDWDCALSECRQAEDLGATEVQKILAEARAALREEIEGNVRALRVERDLGRRVELETVTLGLLEKDPIAATNGPDQIAALKAAKARDDRRLSRHRNVAGWSSRQ